MSRGNYRKSSKYYSTKPLLDHLKNKHPSSFNTVKEASGKSNIKGAEKRRHEDIAEDEIECSTPSRSVKKKTYSQPTLFEITEKKKLKDRKK